MIAARLSLVALVICVACQQKDTRPSRDPLAPVSMDTADAVIREVEVRKRTLSAPPPESPQFRFGPEDQKPREEQNAEVPLSLTASDGTGLRLVELSARAVVEAPLAFTELHMVFENPRDDEIEGRFRIALPDRASISRFAMRIGERWQEGEVVERQKATQAYEDFLHRRQDPALLEQQAGNEFSARVFPIPPLGKKELILSFSHELVQPSEPYVLPLVGLPEIEQLRVDVLVPMGAGGRGGDRELFRLRKSRWRPDGDFVLPAPAIPGKVGLRSDNLVVARIAPVSVEAIDAIDSLAVLIDTSASRALGFSRQVEILRGLLAGLAGGAGPSTPVLVGCFDQETVTCYEGTAGGFGQDDVRRILDRGPLGASNLHDALAWLGKQANRFRAHSRVLLLTDGVATAGKTEGAELRRAAGALGQVGVRRLDAVVVGGIRNEELLREIVTAGLRRDGAVIDGDASLPAIAHRLGQATHSGLAVAVPNSRWVWPTKIDGVQAGESVLVYAELPKEEPFSVIVAGRPVTPADGRLAAVQRPMLERALVRAQISSLQSQRGNLPPDQDALERQVIDRIVDLSVRHRVLSEYTALLVLETEEDYKRYGIGRAGLADILTVGPTGLIAVQRTADSIPVLREDDVVEAGTDGRVEVEPDDVVGADDEVEGEPYHELAATADEAPEELADAGLSSRGAPPKKSARRAATKAEVEPLSERVFAAERAPPVSEPMPTTPAVDEPRAEPAAKSAPPRAKAAKSRPPRPPPRGEEPDDYEAYEDDEEDYVAEDDEDYEDDYEDYEDDYVGDYEDDEEPSGVSPYSGNLLRVMSLLQKRQTKQAEQAALAWREEAPGDVMALVALGEVCEAKRQLDRAARAYGSIVDLFPSRADMRRYAGQRLERIRDARALALALDTYQQAAKQRPDHPASHRLLAFALLKSGKPEAAFEALARGLERSYPSDRFEGARRILREDLGLIAAAWIRAAPSERKRIIEALEAARGIQETEPSLRFVLYWETDANDVDFHIYDGNRGHAYFARRKLKSGGLLYADVTTGYGPECFTIRKSRGQRTYPYHLKAHYYSRGPMGFGMGKLEIVDHDGRGKLTFDERPFVVMEDGAYLDLGKVTRGL